MKPSTQIYKRLTVGELHDGAATVTLDGREIGRIVRERPGFYGALLGECAAGGGRNIPNALKSLAVHVALRDEPLPF